MDKTVLVTPDFAAGLELVHALDQSGLSISVALWVYLSEYEDWRFLLSSRRLDASARAYGQVHDALTAAGISYEQTPPLMILRISDPFIRSLRRMYSKAANVEGMRLVSQLIGDRFVGDALVYRIG